MRALTPNQTKLAVRSTQKIDSVLVPVMMYRYSSPRVSRAASDDFSAEAANSFSADRSGSPFNATTRSAGSCNTRDAGPDVFRLVGATSPLGAAYYRITGPRVLIEFAAGHGWRCYQSRAQHVPRSDK